MKRKSHNLHYILCTVVGIVMAACASIGHPNGGEYDYDAPVLISITPATSSTSVSKNKITLEFDENVQLEDVQTKVVVSPAQKFSPSITANGHKVIVELRDSLLPNTTYTIDFSDAIKDLNEGNVLDGVATDFSTGESIDSLRISGMLFEAETLEPAQGMLVGVYSNMSDTALTTLPMERIARTNQLGQFTIRGLRNVPYRVFAINDLNRDYHWDRSEDIAFYPSTVTPTAVDSLVTDSLVTAQGTDSLVTRTVTQFLPNDLLLTWFNERYTAQYIKDYARPSRHKITINLGAETDSLPVLRPVGTPLDGMANYRWAMLNRNEGADSLEYFITDSTLITTDSLQLAVSTFRPDKNEVWQWMTDTLNFYFKPPKKKEKKKKDDEPVDTVPTIDFLTLNIQSGTSQELYYPLYLTTEQPIASIMPEGLHMEIGIDSIWETVATPEIVPVDSINLKRYKIDYAWQPGAKYRLTVDSATVTGIYGHWNNTIKNEFKVKNAEDYSALYINIVGLQPDESAMLQLIRTGDRVVDTVSVVNNAAQFPHAMPGEYYMRLFIDRNGNHKWDTGSITDSLQPEETFYFPKKITLKKNWDVEQTWDIYETPVDKQKPDEIKKNKPKDNRVRRRNPDGSYIDDPEGRRNDGYDDDENEFGGDFYGPGFGNGSRNVGQPNQFGNQFGNQYMNNQLRRQ